MLTAGAVIPFSQWMAGQAWARAPLVRRDYTTAAAATDLGRYATAVKTMMAKAESDPQGWMFQWYIHAVRSDRTKAGELARVYPVASPQKTLAQASWSTCQAHSAGTVEDYFLPWHRMYVFFLEAIMRNVIGQPTFALPYWRYTQPAERALASQFRMSGDPTWGSLYRSSRNPGTNAGTAIDNGIVPTPLNTDSLNETTYSPSGGHQGFCAQIDGNLHGNVHVLCGNGTGMGSVPWAANDPVFWMHHCNIDRMWASWNRNGGCNPGDASWLNHQFTFPDANGNSVVATIKDFKAIAPLNYSYDTLEPGPKVGNCNRIIFDLGRLRHLYLYPLPFPIDPAGPVEIRMKAPPRELAAPKQLLSPPGARPRLILEGLTATAPPETLFEVYLKGANGKAQHLGYINFFDAVPMKHDDEMPGTAMSGMKMAPPVKFFSFDVAAALRGIQGAPTIGIRPVGKANREAKLSVGQVRVVMG
jgi:hypothetical protein